MIGLTSALILNNEILLKKAARRKGIKFVDSNEIIKFITRKKLFL